jgi:hypothetical protein
LSVAAIGLAAKSTRPQTPGEDMIVCEPAPNDPCEIRKKTPAFQRVPISMARFCCKPLTPAISRSARQTAYTSHNTELNERVILERALSSSLDDDDADDAAQSPSPSPSPWGVFQSQRGATKHLGYF